MEIGFIALLALWGLSRSGLSSRRVYPVVVNNPVDRLTDGFIGDGTNGAPVGSINQPTYSSMRVGFEAPATNFCYSSPTTLDGMRKYQVYEIEESGDRVIMKIPNGYIGAGQEFNIANWIIRNSGHGYYVMIKGVKSGRGGRENYSGWPSDIASALSKIAIGISWVNYETGQRYIKHPMTPEGKASALAQMNELYESYNLGYDPTPPAPPTPTPDPTPTIPPLIPPTLEPLDPSGGDDEGEPTPIDPTPINPTNPNPFNPQPVGGFNNGSLNGSGDGGLMGGY